MPLALFIPAPVVCFADSTAIAEGFVSSSPGLRDRGRFLVVSSATRRPPGPRAHAVSAILSKGCRGAGARPPLASANAITADDATGREIKSIVIRDPPFASSGTGNRERPRLSARIYFNLRDRLESKRSVPRAIARTCN